MTNEELFKIGEYEELYRQNIKFIYHEAHKYSNQIEFDECVSIANLAFAKTLRFYDPIKNVKFVSYLGTAIKNEFLIYLDKNKKRFNILSLDYKYEDARGILKSLEDLITSDFDLEKEANKSAIIQKLYLTINRLPEKQRKVTLGRLQGFSYKELGADLNCSKRKEMREAF